jgi:hypothetical protein
MRRSINVGLKTPTQKRECAFYAGVVRRPSTATNAGRTDAATFQLSRPSACLGDAPVIQRRILHPSGRVSPTCALVDTASSRTNEHRHCCCNERAIRSGAASKTTDARASHLCQTTAALVIARRVRPFAPPTALWTIIAVQKAADTPLMLALRQCGDKRQDYTPRTVRLLRSLPHLLPPLPLRTVLVHSGPRRWLHSARVVLFLCGYSRRYIA